MCIHVKNPFLVRILQVTNSFSFCFFLVFLSTRRGAWIWGRVGKNGMPADAEFNVRLKAKLRNWFPRYSAWALERELNDKFDHQKFGLKPKHHVHQQHPTLCDALPNRILTGTVVVKPNIRKITGNSVEFTNGSREENIDTILLCTGYSFSFPFLIDNDIPVIDNHVNLYKFAFPPDLPHPTLAAIGLFQPVGAIMPVAEMQLRYACHLLTNQIKLPSQQEMMADIKSKKLVLEQNMVKSRRHTIEVGYVEFMDEFANLINCHPKPLHYLLTDPILCYRLYMGPCVPYQFRLRGPHTWSGARQAILTVEDRILAPLQTRDTECNSVSLIWLLAIFPLFWFYIIICFM